MGFVPLHNHSDYSLLDGASQISKIVDRASDLGMDSIALTDHGVMYGVLDLVKKCKEKGIKPIIGNEMYVINGSIDDPQPKKEKRYHLVVLAKNYIGYKNIIELSSKSYLENVSLNDPHCKFEDLLHFKEGIIILSGSINSLSGNLFNKGLLLSLIHI